MFKSFIEFSLHDTVRDNPGCIDNPGHLVIYKTRGAVMTGYSRDLYCQEFNKYIYQRIISSVILHHNNQTLQYYINYESENQTLLRHVW